MPRLVIDKGPEAGRVYQLDQPVTTVGRSVSNHIQIVDRRMSRNHAELHTTGSRVILRDLGSKNGTILNGQPVSGSVELRQGDRVIFGDTELVYVQDDLPGAPASRGTDSSMGSPPPGSPSSTSRGAGMYESSSASSSASASGSSSASSSSGSGFRVLDENQWGKTKGAVRAGFDPSQGTIVGLSPQKAATLDEQRELYRRLEVMYKITDAIRSVFSLEELLDKIMEIIQSQMHPDRSYLLLINQQSNELEPAVVKTVDQADSREVHISKSITARCLDEGMAILVSDAAADMRFNASESIIMNRIRTAMVAPLIYKNEKLGVVYIDTQSRAMAFTKEELEMLTSIANQAAVAIVNARMQATIVEQHKLAREMEIARAIQMNLLPKVYPDLPGYQISAMSQPAKQVGGDYYDFLKIPDGRVGLAIADVSGKGVSAAILTATTRSYLNSETQHKDSTINHAIERINSMVFRDVSGGSMYVTMVLAYLDPVEGRIEYVNAGHAYPVVLTPNGEISYLKTGGLFLGIAEDGTYSHDQIMLPPGGVLVMYTDGVTDITDHHGRHFGTDRFLELLRDKQHLSAEEIRNEIYNHCLKHRGHADQFDDFTLIVLKRLNFNESEID